MLGKNPVAMTGIKQTSPSRRQKKQGTKIKNRRAQSRRARKRLPRMPKRAKKRSPRRRNKPRGVDEKTGKVVIPSEARTASSPRDLCAENLSWSFDLAVARV